MTQEERWAEDELRARTEFVVQVLGRLTLRGSTLKSWWFRVVYPSFVEAMHGNQPMGHIAMWEIEAAVKELVRRERAPKG